MNTTTSIINTLSADFLAIQAAATVPQFIAAFVKFDADRAASQSQVQTVLSRIDGARIPGAFIDAVHDAGDKWLDAAKELNSPSLFEETKTSLAEVGSAQATVVFDTQPPLDTPQIFDTLDNAGSLTSQVAPLPATETTTQFNVSWSSGQQTAGASGVADYTIYVSDNGGPFTPWLVDTTLTQAAPGAPR